MTVSSAENADLGTETQNPDVPAESSPATEGVPSLYEAVDAALGDKEEAPASEEPGSEEPDSEAPSEDEQASEGEDDLSEEELSRLSERTQRRFRELVEQRKSAEGRLSEIESELEAVRPKAERMDELMGYMHQHAITPEHLNNALGITAMINRGDYASALPVLENLVNQVRSAAGEVLPPDLQREVELGYITEARAKELHKSRIGEQRVRESAEAERQRMAAERQHAELEALVSRTTRTADDWSKEQAKSDPDWNLKRDRVTEKVELELRRRMQQHGPQGYPRTEDEVRQLLDQVRQEVDAEIKRFRPAPKPITPSPTGGSASPRSKAQPQNLMEAVDMALYGGE